MDRMVDQMRRSMLGEGPLGAVGSDMNVRTETTEDAYVVLADLPGFASDDISARFVGDRLDITAINERNEDEEDVMLTATTRMHESLEVPEGVRREDVTATYRNGVLEITLPLDGEVEEEHVIDIE